MCNIPYTLIYSSYTLIYFNVLKLPNDPLGHFVKILSYTYDNREISYH